MSIFDDFPGVFRVALLWTRPLARPTPHEKAMIFAWLLENKAKKHVARL